MRCVASPTQAPSHAALHAEKVGSLGIHEAKLYPVDPTHFALREVSLYHILHNRGWCRDEMREPPCVASLIWFPWTKQ